MNQSKPKEVRTLSIRIPMDLYLNVSQHGIDKDLPSLNSAVIALLSAGLEVTSERDKILSQFILEVVPPEKLKEIISGR
jgi:hypothetical protein